MEKEREYLPLLLLLYPKEQRHFKTLWNEFKYSYHLEDVRQLLAQCLETCLCSEHSNFSEPMDRSNIAFFIGEVMALLEARYQKEIDQNEQYRQFTTGNIKPDPNRQYEETLPDQQV